MEMFIELFLLLFCVMMFCKPSVLEVNFQWMNSIFNSLGILMRFISKLVSYGVNTRKGIAFSLVVHSIVFVLYCYCSQLRGGWYGGWSEVGR